MGWFFAAGLGSQGERAVVELRARVTTTLRRLFSAAIVVAIGAFAYTEFPRARCRARTSRQKLKPIKTAGAA
jgi:hypothetical protein